MYRHTVTLYDQTGKLLAKIEDAVNLRDYGYTEYESGKYLGAPVEAAFSHQGKYLWVSNYNMIGEGFNNPGCDACHGKQYDPGFLYKINTASFEIESVIKVGAIPKYLAISPDEKTLVVSNWSSGDISIVDMEAEKEVKSVDVGVHPRGVAITSDSKKAYVTVMGSTKVAVVDLETYEVDYILNVGSSPRHLVLTANDSLLYISVNSSNTIVKYNTETKVRTSCKTNSGPRSMIMSPNEKYLYVVNYFTNTFSKVATDSMQVIEVVKTSEKPIGITANWDQDEIWVACYSGKIEIFKDFMLQQEREGSFFDFEFDLSQYFTVFNTDNEISSESASLNAGERETDSLITIEDTPNLRLASNPDKQPLQKKEDESLIASNDNLSDEPLAEAPVEISKAEEAKKGPKVNGTNFHKPNFSSLPKKQNENEVSCTFHIIVGSFSILENAENVKEDLENKGYPAQILPGKLNYVSAQCFVSRETAQNNISAVKSKTGMDGWILKW